MHNTDEQTSKTESCRTIHTQTSTRKPRDSQEVTSHMTKSAGIPIKCAWIYKYHEQIILILLYHVMYIVLINKTNS